MGFNSRFAISTKKRQKRLERNELVITTQGNYTICVCCTDALGSRLRLTSSTFLRHTLLRPVLDFTR